jgi:hypothetical protein
LTVDDLFEEDRVLREHLATFGADALRELESGLNGRSRTEARSCARWSVGPISATSRS